MIAVIYLIIYSINDRHFCVFKYRLTSLNNHEMKLFAITTIFATAVTALAGQLSNVQNQRLQFDLAQQLDHRRQIRAAIAKINRLPVYHRPAAIRRLQDAVRQLQRAYGVEVTVVEKRENRRREHLRQYHQ